jgi:putative PEP-CTERM system histidine kinase
MSAAADLAPGLFGMLAAVAHAALAVLVVARRLQPPPRLVGLVVMATLATAAAGLVVVLVDATAARPVALVAALLWTALLALAGRILRDTATRIVGALAVLLAIAAALVAPADPWLIGMASVGIIGLFLVSGLAGGGTAEGGSARRQLCLGLGALFTLDIAVAALALARSPLLDAVETVRPLLAALVAPLLAVGLASLPRPGGPIVVPPAARRLALAATATAVAVLGVAAAAAWLGRASGPVLGLALALPCVLALLATAVDGRAGRRLDAWLGHGAGPHRYDYRTVWPDFVDVLSGADPRPSDDLPERVIRAVAGTVDARGGAIWLAEGDDRYRRLAVHGLQAAQCGSGRAHGLATALLDLERRAAAANDSALADALRPATGPLPDGIPWPDFLPPREKVWLVLPLVHKSSVFGFLVLANPRQPRPLDQEDRELLRLVSRQATSYLAEDEAARQLASARQFENFTRRFAYVMHDVKNVAAELALTLANAKKHRGNQAFYEDMLETLEFSVARMNRLIDQLRQERHPRLDRVPLAPLLRRVAGRRVDPRLRVAEPLTPVAARVEAEALESALEHLVDNALEAVGPRGQVTLRLERQGRMAALVVADDGPGLPPEIMHNAGRSIAFASRKRGGLGLGLDQARNTVERVGGRFDLASSPGRGTTIALCLPDLPMAEDQPA